ncbi:hypothetical protein [Sphingobium baderi]|uniref:hypothetical protein n=1 Tax=Sphingobium baderi TaxID=1332080 RepID=UPI001E2A24DD|nr:hypothetical protein [Sphingobium baderi]
MLIRARLLRTVASLRMPLPRMLLCGRHGRQKHGAQRQSNRKFPHLILHSRRDARPQAAFNSDVAECFRNETLMMAQAGHRLQRHRADPHQIGKGMAFSANARLHARDAAQRSRQAAKSTDFASSKGFQGDVVRNAVWSEPVSSLHFPDFRPNQISPEK